MGLQEVFEGGLRHSIMLGNDEWEQAFRCLLDERGQPFEAIPFEDWWDHGGRPHYDPWFSSVFLMTERYPESIDVSTALTRLGRRPVAIQSERDADRVRRILKCLGWHEATHEDGREVMVPGGQKVMSR